MERAQKQRLDFLLWIFCYTKLSVSLLFKAISSWDSVTQNQKHPNGPSLKTFRNEILTHGFECATSFPGFIHSKRMLNLSNLTHFTEFLSSYKAKMKKSAEGRTIRCSEELYTASHVYSHCGSRVLILKVTCTHTTGHVYSHCGSHVLILLVMCTNTASHVFDNSQTILSIKRLVSFRLVSFNSGFLICLSTLRD